MPPIAPAPTARAESAAVMFPPPGVRAAVFDVVHTLVEPWPPVVEAYHEAARRHGVHLAPAVVGERFTTAWRRQEAIDAAAPIPFATSRSREADRWRSIVADVFTGTAATEVIFADLWAHFGRPEAWRPVPAGRELVLAARAAGLPVVLASNFDERLLSIAAVVEPLTLADHVFASSELGWRKPAAAFFRAVEQRLGLRPEELLLVGDDPELDVAAALRAGWKARPLT
ncbi:MAG: HAD-IA family hydrolase [Pirellulales bacterium]